MDNRNQSPGKDSHNRAGGTMIRYPSIDLEMSDLHGRELEQLTSIGMAD